MLLTSVTYTIGFYRRVNSETVWMTSILLMTWDFFPTPGNKCKKRQTSLQLIQRALDSLYTKGRARSSKSTTTRLLEQGADWKGKGSFPSAEESLGIL